MLDDFNEALKLLSDAVEIEKNSHEARLMVGVVLRSMGKHEEAIAFHHETLKKHPKSDRVLYDQSLAPWAVGDSTRSITALAEAIRLAPKGHYAKRLQYVAQNFARAKRNEQANRATFVSRRKSIVACFRKRGFWWFERTSNRPAAANLPQSVDLTTDFAEFDATFHAWQARHPGKLFSDYSAHRTKSALDKGRPHTTLGPTLINENDTDWQSNGIPAFESILQSVNVNIWDNVCDYGCGSLRVGLYFIKRQEAGRYFGLDVSEDFIAYGREVIGASLLEEKHARAGSIASMIDEVVAAGIDILFAVNVACHIHPDEFETFIKNLHRICHKPGSAVVIQAIVSETALRYQRSSWARPLQEYIEAMQPLVLEKDVEIGTSERLGRQLATRMLTFRRA